MSQFTSDNRSGMVPEVLAAITEANASHAPSYGEDEWTRLASDGMRALFEIDCDVYFVATGTAANALALASLCESYHSVICHQAAHIETDECGAPEFFSNGTKLLLADGAGGKIEPSEVIRLVKKRNDIHYPKPRALSLTQATECGTVYSLAELKAVCETAKEHKLKVHMDGARFANAVASLGCSPADITWRAGVDVLCFGGTKNGMMGGEAILFFDRDLSLEFASRCKQSGQLISKMRFVAAQWLGLLNSGTNGATWLHYAAHANAMAKRIHTVLAQTGRTPMFPVEANSVFVALEPHQVAWLKSRGWELYTFIGGGVRIMCSWDTKPEDVARLGQDLSNLPTAG